MDYQKSYVLMWVGIIAGFILAAVGGATCDQVAGRSGRRILLAGISADVLVLPLPPLRRTLGHPRRRSPLLPPLRGVHLVREVSRK